jgi:peptide/nickel transport system substrate-binding protein
MKRMLFFILVLMVLGAPLVFSGGEMESAQPAETVSFDKNTLVMANPQDINNFNAFTQQYIAFEVIKYNCYEPLFIFNGEGDLEPALATSIEVIDDLTYQIILREGVEFHNGEMFKASDVKFTMDYIQNNVEAAYYRPFISMVEDVEIVDDYTVMLHLSAPNPDMIGSLTLIAIVKEGTEDLLDSMPIGTGPYKFVEWQPNEKTEFVKFENYWDEGKPYIDKFILRPLTDPKIQVANLESLTVQFVKDLPLEEFDALNENSDIELFTTESSNTVVVLEIGQANNPALQNPKALEAMWYAMDRERINKSCFNGLGNIVDGAYPSSAKYFNESKEISYDIDMAKQLLVEAGYADGFEFDLHVLVGFPWIEKLAQIWQAGLAQAGITVNIKKVEASQWIDTYLSRSMDVIINFYSMPGLDPSQFDNTITVPLTQAAFPKVNELLPMIEAGRSQIDSPQREALYMDIQNYIMREYPYYIPIEMPVLFGMAKELEGVEINSFQHIHLKDAKYK